MASPPEETVTRNATTSATVKKEANRKKPVLAVVGGGFAGMLACRNMHKHFKVVLFDAKEYFEYVPGIPRAFIEPECHSELSFQYQPVCDNLGVEFKWAEVKKVDIEGKKVEFLRVETGGMQSLSFNYVLITVGVEYTMAKTHAKGASPSQESLWYPTVLSEIVEHHSFGKMDERFLAGRRMHLEIEAERIKELAEKKGTIVVIGAGPVGLEFATEAKHAYPDINVVLCEKRDHCLAGLPPSACRYAQKWMDRHGIKCIYNYSYGTLGEGDSRESDDSFLNSQGVYPDRVYIAVGTLAVNGFMSKDALFPSKGPGRGGQIRVNKCLQIVDEKGAPLSDCAFAAGTCMKIVDFEEIIAGKVAPAEETSKHACHNIEITQKMKTGTGGCCGFCKPKKLNEFKYAGMAAITMDFDLTSVGPNASTFVAFNRPSKSGSGCFLAWGCIASILKETMIGWTKIDQCKGGWRGRTFWKMVGH